MTLDDFATDVCTHCIAGRVPSVLAGQVLQRLRLNAGIGLREMARRLDRSAGYLSDIERGNRAVSWSTAEHYLEEIER